MLHPAGTSYPGLHAISERGVRIVKAQYKTAPNQ